MLSFSAKTKGGQVTKWGKNEIFWADRNFWPMGWPGIPKFGRVKKISLAGIFNNFLFESKTKNLCGFKVGQFGIFEKHGLFTVERVRRAVHICGKN